MNLFYGDPHYGHRSVIELDHRPFLDVEEMDNVLIYLYNGRVSKDDHVYFMGDFAYRNEKPFSWYLKQLPGYKHLIVGNHDKKLLEDAEAMSYFESVDSYLELNEDKKRLILCHYPLAEWNCFFKESWHIYAHIHNTMNDAFKHMSQYERALNAGCMLNGYAPVSLNELIRNNKAFKETMRNNATL